MLLQTFTRGIVANKMFFKTCQNKYSLLFSCFPWESGGWGKRSWVFFALERNSIPTFSSSPPFYSRQYSSKYWFNEVMFDCCCVRVLYKNRPDNRADMHAFKAGTVKADMHICHLGWFIFWPVGGLHVMSLRTSFMACYCHLAIGRSLFFVCLFVFLLRLRRILLGYNISFHCNHGSHSFFYIHAVPPMNITLC